MEKRSASNAWSNKVGCLFLLGFLVAIEISSAASLRASCNGSIAECQEEEEFLTDSEIHARFLADQRDKYITYPPLNKNNPVCNTNGKPYTGNCVPNQANPQTRGCEKIYRCKSRFSRLFVDTENTFKQGDDHCHRITDTQEQEKREK